MIKYATFSEVDLILQRTDMEMVLRRFVSSKCKLKFFMSQNPLKPEENYLTLLIAYTTKEGTFAAKIPLQPTVNNTMTLYLRDFIVYHSEFYKILMDIFLTLPGSFTVLNHKLNDSFCEEYMDGHLVRRVNTLFDEDVGSTHVDICYYLQLISQLEESTDLTAAEKAVKLVEYEKKLTALIENQPSLNP